MNLSWRNVMMMTLFGVTGAGLALSLQGRLPGLTNRISQVEAAQAAQAKLLTELEASNRELQASLSERNAYITDLETALKSEAASCEPVALDDTFSKLARTD